MHGTPNSDDGLRIVRTTDLQEVRDFVSRRVKDPIEIDGVTVWNFSTHEPDMRELRYKVEHLRRDQYIIPYQVPGAWGYMQDLLPDELREAELLVYSRTDGTYKAFPNLLRESKPRKDWRTRRRLNRWLTAYNENTTDARDDTRADTE